ncbi:MAG: fused response regulator/phosphatase [Proteobacteria bacterium]|nr:fused response regulator/phosphatase [Pseudomonadota bacterium]
MQGKAFTVMIVDDDQLSRNLMRLFLKPQGYQTILASNGQEAREFAEQHEPDLILLDVNMRGGEDGFETCRKLKKNPITADIPVVFVSSMDDVKSKVEGLEAGAWDFIAKPYRQEEILARVKNYLKLRYSFQRIIEEQSKRLLQIHEAQQAILVKPKDLPKAGFGVYYLPILEAGGDFYDVFELGPDIFGYFVSDISGHDLGASFATSAVKALIRQNSSLLHTPDETFRMINKITTSIFSPGQHLTAAYGYLDRAKSVMHIVNAAHLPVLHLSAEEELRWIEIEGDILGAFENGYYNCITVEVSPGDRLYFFSDGLIESFDSMPRTRDQGMAELGRAVIETGKLPIQETVDNVAEKMFARDRKPEDDVLLLGVEI